MASTAIKSQNLFGKCLCGVCLLQVLLRTSIAALPGSAKCSRRATHPLKLKCLTFRLTNSSRKVFNERCFDPHSSFLPRLMIIVSPLCFPSSLFLSDINDNNESVFIFSNRLVSSIALNNYSFHPLTHMPVLPYPIVVSLSTQHKSRVLGRNCSRSVKNREINVKIYLLLSW